MSSTNFSKVCSNFAQNNNCCLHAKISSFMCDHLKIYGAGQNDPPG